jgi:thiol-disulfide isomerase/thioredoxin
MRSFNNSLITSLFYNFLAVVVIITFLSWSDPAPALKNGIWRTSIQRQDGQVIIFNFETKDSAGQKILYVLNGSEKLLVDNIKLKGDSVFIEMPFFESGFAAKLDKDGNLQGSWLRKDADQILAMPFSAIYNQRQRFPVTAPPLHKINGRWTVVFTGTNNHVIDAVGEFQQKGSKLTGTFLTASGDYRFLEGVVTGDSLKLSGFDGGHAYLFTARVDDDNSISGGNFYSGAARMDKWTAKRNPDAVLPDGYEATTLRPGENKLNFRFRSTDDKTVSINDTAYNGKVVIVQIMGSWCPNCMDETKFLSEYYKANSQKGIEVIGLAYERTTDPERSKKSITSFQNRFKVSYPILITGVTATDSLLTEKTLPQLNKIKSFPTSIFIDKKGVVRKIYTGFTGPGTGVYYDAFRKEFDETVKGLLSEK